MEFNMIAPSFFLSTEDVNSAAEKDVWLEEAYLRFGVRFLENDRHLSRVAKAKLNPHIVMRESEQMLERRALFV